MKTIQASIHAVQHCRITGFPQWLRQPASIKLFLVLALGIAAAPVLGQGTVNFANRITGVLLSRVYMPEAEYSFFPEFGNTANDNPPGTQIYTGGQVFHSGWVAQLWAAPGADQPESALQPAYPITIVRTGATLGGAVAPVTVTLTNVPADYPVATVQIRVWPSQYGNWFQAQFGASGDVLGKSLLFNVEAIGGGTNPPANLVSLRSFSLIRNLLDTPEAKPLIYVQPQHQSVFPGGSVTFRAETSLPANKPLSWRFNGSNIVSGWAGSQPETNGFDFPMLPNAGGTLVQLGSSDFFFGFPETNLLQLTNVQLSQAGIYSLVVSNYCCSFPGFQPPFTVSSNAVLTIGNPGALAATRDSLQQIVLNWGGVFFLQSATNVSGPFTDLPGPVVFSPYTNTDSSGPRFFRLRN